MPLLMRERQLKRRREEITDFGVAGRLLPKAVVRDAVRSILVTGQAHRHAAWQREQQSQFNGTCHLLRSFLKRLLTILDNNLEPNALCWSDEGESPTIRLVNAVFDEHAIGMKHGMILHGTTAVSANVLVQLLVKKCGFVAKVLKDHPQQQQQQQHTVITELSHQYFYPGRIDLIARIRFDGGATKHQKDTATTTTATHFQRWPSGATATTIHLADERQYPSLLNNSQKTWPEPLDSSDNDGVDDDDDSSLDDEELDAMWDKEVSDGIDIIQFSNDKLTQVVSSHPATRAAMPLDNNEDDTDVSLQRSRTLLLQTCWERAVHMASTTFTTTTVSSETSQQQPPPPPSSNNHTTTIPLPPVRTPSMAKQACQRWNHQQRFDNATASQHDQQYVCSVCRNAYSLNEQLELHFFGTLSTEGCCWVGIAYARRRFIRNALFNEVDMQRRLVLQAILQKQPTTSNNAFGVLDTLEEIFCNSSQTAIVSTSSSNRPVTSETLQISAQAPPMVLNHHVLESARHRIVERYTTMRR